MYAGAMVMALAPVHGAVAAAPAPVHPPVPTPCPGGGSCGGNPGNVSFVQAGQVGTPAFNGSTLTVNQASQTAILNWQDFNVAKGYTVNFKQPGATASTLNRIWSADPSNIAGKLTANGQIYLINQNGIVFKQGAQVNVGGLVASTLNVTDGVYSNGILSANPNITQAATALNASFSDNGTPAGTVSVEQGATLATTASGGRIVLLGTKVSNAGSITTPDGQTILGAGNSVYLAASTDPALRGLLIEVNGGGNPANSTVTNTGQISAPRGNVTLAGLVVNQAGSVSATTSVSQNGSIYLVAGDTSSQSDFNFYNGGASQAGFGTMLPNTGGTLTLAPGSVTTVTADASDTGTVSLQNLPQFQGSKVGLVGATIDVQSNATVRAPGAAVTALAAADPFQRQSEPSLSPTGSDGSRIYVDAGASIDVSGLTDVPVPVTQNLVTVKLESNDLQDDPLLRSGFLHGKSVTIDVGACMAAPKTCSTLFDLTPYVNNIGFGIGQVLTNAGSIKLDSSGDIITRAGSALNVSGGSVAFQSAVGATTTRLLGADGHSYSIATAPTTVQYVALANGYSYTDPTWGVTTSFTGQSAYSGYSRGGNAGALAVEAPQLYLRGEMAAATDPGLYQRSVATLPIGGTFTAGDSVQASRFSSFVGGMVDLRAPALLLAGGAQDALGNQFDPLSPASVLPVALAGSSVLSPSALAGSGFTNLNFFSNGPVTLPASEVVPLASGGSLSALGQSVEIDGRIAGPGASVHLQSSAFTDTTGTSTNAVTLGPGASIDVSGSWVNDSVLAGGGQGSGAFLTNGGSVSLQAQGNLVLGAGSTIDVSGGGAVSATNQVTPGNAGSIVLAADFGEPGRQVSTGAVELGSGVTLSGGSLAGASGGTLTLQSGSVEIGTDAAPAAGALVLAPDFFQTGGFAQYNVTGIDGATIGVGAPVVLKPQRQNLVFNANPLLQATGSRLQDFAQLQLLDPLHRSAASISFGSNDSLPLGPAGGNVTLGAGSVIATDPLGAVNLSVGGNAGNLEVLGSIAAPAGRISLSLGSSTGATDTQFIEGQQIHIGGQALLSATGYALVSNDNAQGLRQGQVLSAGTISLRANRGSVVADAGSSMDVSGAAAVLDLPQSASAPAGAGTAAIVATPVAGNAGTISIDAREGLVLQGSLKGAPAAVASAAGGTLSIGLDLYDHNTDSVASSSGFVTSPRVLTISDQPAAFLPGAGSSTPGQASISEQSLLAGGFDKLTLKSTDVLALDGVLNLHVRGSLVLDAPQLQANPGTSASLQGAYVGLGDYFGGGPNVSAVTVPTDPRAVATGNGSLTVIGQTLDVRGTSEFSGFASTTLESLGDLRFGSAQTFQSNAQFFNAGLVTSGDVTLQAAQVYPETGIAFTLATPGSLQVLAGSGGTAPVAPLSAAGSITLSAHSIDQQGTLLAPLGQIALDAQTGSDGSPGSVTLAAGSVTSVSANGQVIPFGATQNGQQWLYAGNDLVSAPPAKQISLSGASVTVAHGATVDLSGGGDLYAYEFIAGPGGSRDVLGTAAGLYNYAIMPSRGTAPAPLDAQYSTDSPGPSQAGQDIYLSGVPGIAPGFYTLLPARYALLPGAYAVRVLSRASDALPGAAVQQADGSYVVAARFGIAGTGVEDSRTSTVSLVPGAVVRTQSQYVDSYGNAFFSARAASAAAAVPPLPADGGALQLSASTALSLDGNVSFRSGSFTSGTGSDATVQSGRAGTASIVAPDIEVGEGAPLQPDALLLSPATLNALGAQTLVLGATIASGSGGAGTAAAPATLTVGATRVDVHNSSTDALVAPDIILAASGGVTLESGADVEAKGAPAAPTALQVSGDGAVVQVSTAPSTSLLRTGVSAGAGALDIGAGARVQGSGSLLLDAAGQTSLDPGATVGAPAVTLSASAINIGDVPSGITGLDVSNALLGNLAGLTDLTLHSYGTVDLFGQVQLGGGSTPLDRITVDAAGLIGHGAGSKQVTASNVTLENTGAGVATAGDGSGALTVSAQGASGAAGSIVLGSGSKTLSGFSGVTLQTNGDVQAQGQGGAVLLQGAGDLTVQAARVDTADGADQGLRNATGAVTILGATGAAPALPAAGIGGRISIDAATALTQSGVITTPAGAISLSSGSGDLTLSAGSVTAAAGVVRPFGDTFAAAPGGRISLSSSAGNILAAAGSRLDVSGGTAAGTSVAGSAGSLTASAPAGQVLLQGTLAGGAARGQTQASFTLDTGTLGSLDDVANALAAGGFGGDVSVRVRSGALLLDAGQALNANGVTLSADHGGITIDGHINTGGGSPLSQDGGAINLWASDNVVLGGTGGLTTDAGATAAGARSARGGDVTIGTTAGAIDLQGGSRISQAGNQAAGDGTLTLRAPRTAGGADLAVTEVASTLPATATVVLEGTQVYQATTVSSAADGGGNLSTAVGGTAYTAAQGFAGNAAAIQARLLPGGTQTVEVRPAVEVDSTGPASDLALSDGWDLSQWHFNGVPINLTLRASGNLQLNGSISDGFDSTSPAARLLGGSSATLRLTGGADLAAADPLATLSMPAGAAADVSPASGNVALAPGALVRTGTGSISVAAGGDVLIGCPVAAACNATTPGFSQPLAQQAVIYTAGAPSAALDGFVPPSSSTGIPLNNVWYPTGGGDVALTARGDIVSAPTTQLITDWQWRQGSLDASGNIAQATTWWIDFATFQQGVGALGGGNVRASAGGDIVNLSAVVPSTGRLAGAVGTAPDAHNLTVDGGGSLQVSAGGDVKSGVFEVDWGNASVQAGGAVTSGRTVADTNTFNTDPNNTPFVPDSAVFPILGLGYHAGTFSVSAAGGVTLETAVNTTSLPESTANVRATRIPSYFYTTAPTSTLSVVSSGGDIALNDNTGDSLESSVIGNLTPFKGARSPYDSTYDYSNLAVYPPTVDLAALTGSISLNNATMGLLPSASGNLEFLAEQNVSLLPGLRMYEGDPAQSPNPLLPFSNLSTAQAVGAGLAGGPTAVPLPLVPLHTGDSDPVRVVAANGDIVGNTDIAASTIVLPKEAEFFAGGNILNLAYSGKNIGVNDVTLFDAGGNISFATPTDPLSNALQSNPQGILLGGPGFLEALAGGNVNLGDSNGIVTSGSLNDSRLPASGATLVTAAGLGAGTAGARAPAIPSFTQAYLAPKDGVPSAYAQQLIDYMRPRLGLGTSDTLTYADALTAFEALPAKLQLPLASQVLYDELSASGIFANTAAGKSLPLAQRYKQGYTAIATLFPTLDAQGKALSYSGDINMFFSQLKTEQGGDVDLLAPGGSVVVGLPNPPASLSQLKSSSNPFVPAAANLGTLALSAGAVQGFADQNFTVNQSRILTLEGGNIILWASNGDIDAGRGAKSASAAPPPIIETDAQGNVFVNPLNAVAGSGIGQLVSTPGIIPGLVNLIAPKGDVNAGDAGIRVAGNLNIAAVVVIGADNISVGGLSTGVPVSDAGALSGALSGAGAVGDVGKNTVNQLSQNIAESTAAGEQLAQSLRPTFVEVKLFCLGNDCELQ